MGSAAALHPDHPATDEVAVTKNRVSNDEARILCAVREIPEGFVRTYGDVWPPAPRLTGRVLKMTTEEVPWWRVVRADGTLAAGEEQSRRLIEEGVPLRSGRVDLDKARLPDG